MLVQELHDHRRFNRRVIGCSCYCFVTLLKDDQSLNTVGLQRNRLSIQSIGMRSQSIIDSSDANVSVSLTIKNHDSIPNASQCSL